MSVRDSVEFFFEPVCCEHQIWWIKLDRLVCQFAAKLLNAEVTTHITRVADPDYAVGLETDPFENSFNNMAEFSQANARYLVSLSSYLDAHTRGLRQDDPDGVTGI